MSSSLTLVVFSEYVERFKREEVGEKENSFDVYDFSEDNRLRFGIIPVLPFARDSICDRDG